MNNRIAAHIMLAILFGVVVNGLLFALLGYMAFAWVTVGMLACLILLVAMYVLANSWGKGE